MNASKLADVGQIRRRRGISMNMRISAEHLWSSLATFQRLAAAQDTYIRMMLNIMRRLKWKMLAMPKANPRIIHKTPSL